MKKTVSVCVTILSVSAVALAGIPPRSLVAHPPQGPAVSQAEFVTGNTAFAADLYAKLRERDGNIFFSPYSISTALAMTYAGARGNTATQMAATLHFTLRQEVLHLAFAGQEKYLNEIQSKKKVKLHVANSLWPQKDYPFLPAYLDLVKRNYGVGVTPVDFKTDADGARTRINKWVSDKTNDKIKDLMPAGVLNDLTRLVLINAIYFKGNWAEQFRKSSTRDLPFQVSRNKTVTVPTMTQQKWFGYREEPALQVLEMPYAGNDLSMIVLLPKAVDGLAALEKDLSARNLIKWTTGLQGTDVIVFLPRFRTTAEFSLNGTLSSMGMSDAFDLKTADLSGMDGKRDLFINAVVHKAFVDVNEEGTEAAAATGVAAGVLSAPAPPVTFRADHPFMFLIRDNQTGTILFLGRVSNPKTE